MQDDEFGRSLVAVAGYGVVALNPLLMGDGAGQASEQRHGEAKARAMAALALRAQYDGKHRSVGSGALLGVMLRPVTIYIEENRRVQPTGTAVAYGGSSPGCDSRDDSTKVPAGQDDTATAWSGMMPRGVVKNPLSVCSLERTEVRMDESGAGRGQSHEGAARSAEVMGQALEQGQKRRLSGCGPAGAEAVAKEIDAVHRKKRERLGEFDSDRERTEVKVEREVAALVALMPEQVREHILGGPRGMQQVPGREAQDAIIRRMLKTREQDRMEQMSPTRGLRWVRCVSTQRS